MGRMMPGWVRKEGIDLYESGKLETINVENSSLFLTIDQEKFVYGLDDAALSCTCSFFAQRHYCKHLAAVEYFLKNDPKGRELCASLEESSSQEALVERTSSFGSLFLDQLLPRLTTDELRYLLTAQGQFSPFDQNINWTLKITRLPDQRSYIIRDIGVFLRQVNKGGAYSIGRQYYETLLLEWFDEPSQALICFLNKLVQEKSILESEVLSHMGRHLRLPLLSFEEGLDLLQGLSEFEFQYGEATYQELSLQQLNKEAHLFHFAVEVEKDAIWLRVQENSQLQDLFYGSYVLYEHTLYALSPHQVQIRKLLHSIEEIDGVRLLRFAIEDRAKVALSLHAFETLGQVEAPKAFEVREFVPSFRIEVGREQGIDCLVSLDFSGTLVQSQEELDNLPFTVQAQVLSSLFAKLEKLGFQGGFHRSHPPLKATELYPFFVETLPALRILGQVELAKDIEDLWIRSKPQLRIQQKGSLLDISFDVKEVAEDEIDQALAALMSQQAYFTTKSGKVLVFDEETRKISQTLHRLREQFQSHRQGWSLSRLATYQLAQDLEQYQSVHFSEELQDLAYDLARPEAFSLPDVVVNASLREYQELGVRWLSMLNHHGFGGILADDMGLGKTLQTIAFLSGQLRQDSKVLILAPASLIYNWQEECHRFAPQLDVAVVYGHKEERESQLNEEHQIVITSYTSFRQDISSYRRHSYDYLILDEAQVVKNTQTKIAQHLREFEVRHCFALSGTPIENHLGEIWSIFQIVLPGLLPSKKQFQKLSADEVSRLIRPFILRRKKEDVLTELPDRLDVTVLNELKEQQKIVYLAQLRQMQEKVNQSNDQELNRQKIEILSGITRLRQICDTPKLFLDSYHDDSGKLEQLRDLLVQLKENKHRVLIFSQFRQMLDIIETELEDLGVSSYKLTGRTPARLRQEMTRAFNTGSRDAFLISLKAGGVGLNLTGADTVILVDLWWNPAAEEQAISRTHRMGQTDTVEVYRLITRGTIEEKIQELQTSKKNLVTAVLDGNESRSSLTVEEIRDILGIS